MDEIVIAGISGRLPESNNLEEFWENLISGVDMVTEDDRRWTPGETPHRVGFDWIILLREAKITDLLYWLAI